MMVMTCSTFSDELYKKELESFAANHGDNPRYAFILVDYYFYQGQYDKALKALVNVIKRYKNDASLLTLRANILMLKKDYATAYQDIALALKNEPDYEDAYWTATTITLNEQKFDKTLIWLKQLEERFGYNFAAENFAGQETYKDFILSDEYKNWIKSKTE